MFTFLNNIYYNYYINDIDKYRYVVNIIYNINCYTTMYLFIIYIYIL